MDVNDLYDWAVLQKLPVNNFEWIEGNSQYNEDFIKNYYKESDEGYFLDVDGNYLENIYELYNNLPFSSKRMKIQIVKKLLANLHDKTEYIIHTKNLKQALNPKLVLKKVYRVTKFNQNAWLKQYIDINTDLRKKSKKWF